MFGSEKKIHEHLAHHEESSTSIHRCQYPTNFNMQAPKSKTVHAHTKCFFAQKSQYKQKKILCNFSQIKTELEELATISRSNLSRETGIIITPARSYTST